MQVLGYVPRDSRNNGIRNAMCMAMLLQRDAQLDHITVTTLQQIAATCPDYLREASATLSRILAASGTIEEGFDYRITQRRRPPREYNATADVPMAGMVQTVACYLSTSPFIYFVRLVRFAKVWSAG